MHAPSTAHRWPITAFRLIRPTKYEIRLVRRLLQTAPVHGGPEPHLQGTVLDRKILAQLPANVINRHIPRITPRRDQLREDFSIQHSTLQVRLGTTVHECCLQEPAH